MKPVLKVILIFCLIAFAGGCKLAVIVVEGGEVQSRFGNCFEGNVCIIERLPGKNTAELFTAVSYPGWFFHKWNSGERLICGDSALPECELNFSAIEDNTELMAELRASSEVVYLMPVFKNYPRVTLGSEPRTIIAEGKGQLWLQPADFSGYSYDQLNEVCPGGICSGRLPGSNFDLSGHFWASSSDVELLFLAYSQADKLVREDFRITFESAGNFAVIGILSNTLNHPGENLWTGAAGGQWDNDRYYVDRGPVLPGTGVWFWKPLE